MYAFQEIEKSYIENMAATGFGDDKKRLYYATAIRALSDIWQVLEHQAFDLAKKEHYQPNEE